MDRGFAGAFSDNIDFDFLVEFESGVNIDLFEFSKIQTELAKVVGSHVDLVSKKGSKARIKKLVLAEAGIIYAE